MNSLPLPAYCSTRAADSGGSERGKPAAEQKKNQLYWSKYLPSYNCCLPYCRFGLFACKVTSATRDPAEQFICALCARGPLSIKRFIKGIAFSKEIH